MDAFEAVRRGHIRKTSAMRELLDDALDMLAVIARPMPAETQTRRVLVAEIAALRAAADVIEARDAVSSPRFAETSCSQCGRSFGPGEHGFSHCESHRHLIGRP